MLDVQSNAGHRLDQRKTSPLIRSKYSRKQPSPGSSLAKVLIGAGQGPGGDRAAQLKTVMEPRISSRFQEDRVKESRLNNAVRVRNVWKDSRRTCEKHLSSGSTNVEAIKQGTL